MNRGCGAVRWLPIHSMAERKWLWQQLTSYCGLRRGSAALRALRRLGRSKGQSSSFVSSGSSASASAMARAAHGGSIVWS